MPTVHDKFAATRKEMGSLIERDAEIDLCLTALVAQEHVLLVGPPGTAKSMLADALVDWMDGSKFNYQLTKYTTPEELFGPVSIEGLKQDEYRRITTGKLPEAHVSVLDEIFNGSSAILNTTLRVLNERTYQNNGHLMQCPLKLCIGASNQWPSDQEGGKELNALFDRFMFRKNVKSLVSEKSVDKLLWGKDPTPVLSTKITEAELTQATTEAAAMPWSPEAKEAFGEIHKRAKHEGIHPGDRRLRKSIACVQAFSWIEGDPFVLPEHLEILSHLLWDDPIEQPKELAKIVGLVANPITMVVNSLLMEMEQVLADLEKPADNKLAKLMSACKKLAEIHKKLAAMSGEKAKQAAEYAMEKATEIRKQAVEGALV
jgi:MoxR-like ATPase